AERGVVEGNRRAGTRIRPRPAPAPARVAAVLPGTRDLASGNPDPAFLPDVAAVMRTTAERISGTVLYGGDAVVPELAALARAAFAADGVDLPAITITGGALDAVERALSVYLRPGMRVAVEDPGYGGLLDLVAAMELAGDPVAVDDEGMLPEGLAAAIRRGAQAVVVTPRAQNPTGAALTPRRIEALAAVLAEAPGVLLIEDDHAGAVAGPDAVTIPGPVRKVVVRSCSKAYGPDLRVAIVAGDEETVAGVQRRQAVGAGWVSHALQELVLTILALPETPDRVQAARDAYAERRAALVSALAGHGIASMGRSGLNVWVPVPEEAPVLAGMAARGWAIGPGSRHRLASPPAVRVTTARLDPADALAVAAALAATLGREGGTRTG
ncbi:MAG TPA: aminotransferase class I/II-fold pyridoxal phosphate-dependent enzyme, partial [Acidimicrobiales bacterium]|nr:aminotransferase class I/II-fold pyridoxal phosphate-dependent enzyme [Acidimicrobiales bacterium]